jgi:serine/threonine-protein kinase
VGSQANERESEKLIFDKYKLLEPLGRGGMAEVYRALSVGAAGFKRPVVLKRILPALAANTQFVDMFVKEASIAASLDHPNIVQVFDLGEFDGDLFMVMEYVPGATLASVMQYYGLQGKGVPHAVVAYIAVDVCKALECAHEHRDVSGVRAPFIHRDVSPQNVLISSLGTVKLADFGLAMAMSGLRVTIPGVIKGKLGYMSPEQATGDRDLDHRSDLFSLGVVMYEAISGRRLFVGSSFADTIRRIKSAQVPPLFEVAPQAPPALLDVVHQLLARDREKRPESAGEVRRMLSAYLRKVHPPVDATGLAKIVRLVGVESATAQADDGEGNDEVATAAYSVEEGSSGDRPTLSEGGTPRDEAQVSPASEEPPTEETPVVKLGEPPAVVPTDAPDAVIISRIVVIGPPPHETGD